MSSDEAESDPNKNDEWVNESPPSQAKKIRSREPDVIVAVGQGDAMREFPCYAVALSFASDYLDAMLSSSMKEGENSRIEFPDKDPDEWELVYKFINPACNRSAEVKLADVEKLLPWFHEFQMKGVLKECEELLVRDISNSSEDFNSSTYWSDWSNENDDRDEILTKVLHYAVLGIRYSLYEVTLSTHRAIDQAFTYASDLWTTEKIESLIPLLTESWAPCSDDDGDYYLLKEGLTGSMYPEPMPDLQSANAADMIRLYLEKETFKKKLHKVVTMIEAGNFRATPDGRVTMIEAGNFRATPDGWGSTSSAVSGRHILSHIPSCYKS